MELPTVAVLTAIIGELEATPPSDSRDKAIEKVHGQLAMLERRSASADKVADTPSKEDDAEHLRDYWTRGEGAAKIRWGEPGDFDRCVMHLGKYIADPEGYCAERHHDALGIWPATHAAMERGHKGASTPVAAGIAIVADDTGRVLMLQRAIDDDDPAAGQWELPGGRLEPGESATEAARREWSEETGFPVPDAPITDAWTSYNGVYQGFVISIPHEADLPLHGDRAQVANPDDPDGDGVEALAWWSPDQLRGNPAVRDEMHADMNAVMHAITS